MTGTLTYAEPAQLSATARAVVVIVAGTATATSNTIIGTQVIDKPGQQPIAFSVSYKSADINPNLIYTVQAGVEDGQRIWDDLERCQGHHQGQPDHRSERPAGLSAGSREGCGHRLDHGVGITLAQGAYSTAVLIRVDTGETIGVDVNPGPTALPIPFTIDFDPSAIDPNADYVVRAEIVSGDTTFADTTGILVITKGNALTGVVVSVAEVVPPTPSPSPTASPSPSIPDSLTEPVGRADDAAGHRQRRHRLVADPRHHPGDRAGGRVDRLVPIASSAGGSER